MQHCPPHVRLVIRQVRSGRLTYLSSEKLALLASICLRNDSERIPGVIIETGCALGGSSIVMTAAKQRERKLRVYDVFGMIPPPTDEDGPDVHDRYRRIASGESSGIDGDPYYGYEEDLYRKVLESFERFDYPVERNGVELIRGLIQETLVVDGPVSLAHIDVDWYEPVLVSLTRIAPRLSKGGCFVLDDYSAWSGCRAAVDEYFADKREQFEFDLSMPSLVVRKL